MSTMSSMSSLPFCTHTQGAEVIGQLRVNGELRHLRRCTLDGWSLAVLFIRLHVKKGLFLTH